MQTVGLFKRLLVMIYDGLLLFSLVFLSSALLMAVYKFGIAPDSFIEISQKDGNTRILTPFARVLGLVIVGLNTVAVSYFFFGWFWTHGGQTPGMKAWSLYLIKGASLCGIASFLGGLRFRVHLDTPQPKPTGVARQLNQYQNRQTQKQIVRRFA